MAAMAMPVMVEAVEMAGVSAAHAALARELAELVARGETHCVWCGRLFSGRDGIVPAGGGRLMHASPCSDEFDAFVGGEG